ncbi:stage V sporulation protein AD [Thermolongibacillus altinsuensis]|jgi:stage V sporulation protein AD|uniref:Stage V sporulation protein AD n=1 Tax=Thermolongibacillus altinsuensis TaxID=575256 RepID=A0A4R1QSP4_9BACL|nr:stage V sporulation protein AD [Thermolongibacillus altinsuensis]TCL53080.1 stage V sporulation protein AD [Thermolongibacillus altinsuensis]
MKLTGKQTWLFENDIYIEETGTVVGPKEGEGPLRHQFDRTYEDLYCEQPSWELAERQLMKEAIEVCLEKANVRKEAIDFFVAGDLLNQNVTANYVAREMGFPFLGVFGACSTVMEALLIGAMLIDGQFARRVLTATSSHYGAAERQFRFPTTLGVQKANSAAWTVTGGAAALVSKQPSPFRIRAATAGKVIDGGSDNPLNMGTAMAPAAVDTIRQHFFDLQLDERAYDLIVTGDLGKVGSIIAKQMLKEEGLEVGERYRDCGVMIYHSEQNAFAGGSGCACCAVVTYGHLFNEMKRGKVKNMLIVATGALFSPTMIKQKQTIPSIAHAVAIEAVSR